MLSILLQLKLQWREAVTTQVYYLENSINTIVSWGGGFLLLNKEHNIPVPFYVVQDPEDEAIADL